MKQRRVFRYDLEFKRQAVLLSSQPGVLTQDVARELDIHPFMLSRWKKDRSTERAAVFFFWIENSVSGYQQTKIRRTHSPAGRRTRRWERSGGTATGL